MSQKLDQYRDPLLATNEDIIGFYEREFYVLSNFSSFQVEWRGKLWPTSEHAYQAAHFFEIAPKLVEEIFNTKSAHRAFEIAKANANKAGVTTKAGLVKPRTLTEKEVKTFTNNLISAGTFSTQKVYTTTFRAYSLAFPVGSRAGLNQVFNISQKAEGKLSVVLANPVIQRRLIKQARKLRVKLKLRVKPKIKVRIKVKLKPKLRVAPKLKPKLKPKVRVKIKAKVKVKPKIKPKLKPKIKITPRITPIIIPIRIIQPNIPKIPLILGRFRRKKKPLRKVKRKLIKSRKITPKPTRRVSTAVLKRKALLKKDKEVKDGKKKKRKKKDFKVRNLKKRKSRKKIRSKK